MKDLGKTTKFYASIANRTECNVFDLIQSLEDSCSSIGFPGGLEFCTNLVRSSSMKEVLEYVEAVEELPFAQPVYTYPIVRDRRLTPSFLQTGETPETGPVARQRRKEENSLLTLQKRLLSNSPPTSPSKVTTNIQFGKKPVVLSNKRTNDVHMENHASILEAFSLVIEALKSRVSELGENGERDVVDKRHAVCLNFSNGSKLISDSLDLRLWNRGTGRISS
ncbi:hypothetical protein L2E82_32589 [Cichorium intybus]|uniref:Uncharacterized protein n=1 Tax=Cichorium intybus TaxID=13427 RepID=A0ACB9BHM7_CICIN|nr:hypothetical protein L2E82_32589 [Cichorium intybus]